MIPSLFHFYGYTQIGDETGMTGQTRAQRQGDFKDNSYIKCLAILSLTQMHEMMPILRVSMKLISRPLVFCHDVYSHNSINSFYDELGDKLWVNELLHLAKMKWLLLSASGRSLSLKDPIKFELKQNKYIAFLKTKRRSSWQGGKKDDLFVSLNSFVNKLDHEFYDEFVGYMNHTYFVWSLMSEVDCFQ